MTNNREKVRKQLITILFCISVGFMLAGCRGSADGSETLKDKEKGIEERSVDESSDMPSEKTKKTEKQNADQKEKPKEEQTIDPKTVYEPVFSEIFEILDYGYNIDREYKYASGGLTEKINYSRDTDLLNDIGYHLEDMNGDGISELLIGSDEDYADADLGSYIYGIYTVKDDKPVTVATGSAHSSYRYMGNGHFFYCGSLSAMITIIGEDHLNEDGSSVVWDDFYFTDEKENGEVGIFYNDKGLFDTAGSEELEMSEEEFARIMDGYEKRCKPIPWKPIGDIKALSETVNTAESEDTFAAKDKQGSYAGVLYWYKQIQDSNKSWEEMEEYASRTELIQHGWPYSTNNDEIRYVYEDITGDGYDELIITYYNEPVDIYSNEGDAVYSYGVPYRAIVEIYPDGTLMEGLTMGANGWIQTWYRYDNSTYMYAPVQGELHPEMSNIILGKGKKIADIVVPDGLNMLE